jgi:hypothetical protein
MCLNLEHYYSRSCGNGRAVPRIKAKVQSERLDNDAVRVRIEPYESWELEATVTFRLLPRVIVEATYEFSFGRDFESFEVFVSNYFHDPVEPFIRVNGEWRQPRLSDREHRFWARGAREAQDIRSMYPVGIGPEDNIDLPIDDDRYEYPIMVTPIPGSQQSIVNIVEPSCCVSLSANRRWNAHDFSMGFGDVLEGQTAKGKAWLCCTTLTSHDEAIGLFEDLTGGNAQQDHPTQAGNA